MILIACAFLVLVILLVRQYGTPGLTAYLMALVVSWLAAFASSILIIGNQNVFFLIGPRLLPLDWFIVQRMHGLFHYSLYLVTGLNLSTAVFYFCFLGFTIQFSQLPTKRLRKVLGFLTVLPLLIALTFDPFVIKTLSRLNTTRLDSNFIYLGAFFLAARRVAQVIHAGYLVAGMVILYRYVVSKHRTRSVQRSITYMAVGTAIFAVMFAIFHFRSPQLLAIPTFRPPYVRPGTYEIPSSPQMLRVIPFMQGVVLLVFSAAIIRFLRLARDKSYQDTRIRHTLRIASLGGRIIGHRIKNQLFAVESEIRSFASQTAEMGDDMRERLNNLAQMCRQTYQSIGKTIDMLNIPRLRMVLTNIVEAVLGAAERWNQAYPDADICFTASDSTILAYLDRTHFEEVIINLLHNARQAARPGTYPLIFIEIVADTLWISVRITDRGTGIGAADMMHLFEPFYTGHGGATNWGIGLTYCKSIIDVHDGTIEIENSEEGGARVEIGLPRAQEWL